MKKDKCSNCEFLFLADVSASAAILGRKGGAVKSDRKTRASRANGLKGGRPRNGRRPIDAVPTVE